MKNFIGIDLGTTNSAVCSYDGSKTKIWKCPDQKDVTPSAIYFDRRSKHVGARAYALAAANPDNSAVLFKRLMGTSTPISLSAVGMTKTPEECSAEVLKVLYGYLPEEIRNDPDTGTVITVPAAFNQMQKDATMQAATMAGLGKVALMQEPVAAVMSVMRTRSENGMFIIFDLGGGTLDIAIANSSGGRVSLLSHGGIAMCGGRDFDRAIVENVVKPWLLENFRLPEKFAIDPEYRTFMRLAGWATEQAKIELSSRDNAVISLSENEARVKDLDGNEIYLDIPLEGSVYDGLIAELVDESVGAAREAIAKAGLTPDAIGRIVFVGGPTNYKPLRDKVVFELAIKGDTDVNPMTAVAEGASIFAESIDWSSHNHSRKSTRGQVSSGGKLDLAFNYIARTPDSKAKIAVQLKSAVEDGCEFQIDSVDTGWTSGRMPLENAKTLDLSLTRSGENQFKVFVFDSFGSPTDFEQDSIVITRTAATIDAIPASHSVGVEVLDRLGGRLELDYLIKSDEPLPKKGKKIFKAAESLKAGAAGSLNIKIWEGDISNPITDNVFIGTVKISGSDFDDGVIPAGADLECDFEILDSGNIVIEVSVPAIGGVFHSGKNFYSRQEGQVDYTTSAQRVVEAGEEVMSRIEQLDAKVDNPKLHEARKKIDAATSLDVEELETDKSQIANQNVQEAKSLLAQVREEHLQEIRQIDLDDTAELFDGFVKQYARPSEVTAFDNLVKKVQSRIDNNQGIEDNLDKMRGFNFEILWRQDWFVIDKFKSMIATPYQFTDKDRFQELVRAGGELIRQDDIDGLRSVIAELFGIYIGDSSGNSNIDLANIIRG